MSPSLHMWVPLASPYNWAVSTSSGRKPGFEEVIIFPLGRVKLKALLLPRVLM